jgi:hypothetical protein
MLRGSCEDLRFLPNCSVSKGENMTIVRTYVVENSTQQIPLLHVRLVMKGAWQVVQHLELGKRISQ